MFQKNASLKFEFSFNPCHELFPYETATVAVYAIRRSITNEDRNGSEISETNITSTYNNNKQTIESKLGIKEDVISVIPCGQTLKGKIRKPIYVYKSVKLVSSHSGRAVINFVVSKVICFLSNS